jgi:hypothetical protein
MTFAPRTTLLSSGTPSQSALHESLPGLLSHGCTVDLIIRNMPEPWMADLGVNVTSLSLGNEMVVDFAQQRKGSHLPGLRRLAVRGADPALQTWLLIRWNAKMRKKFEDADIVVALDQAAVYTCWKIAQSRDEGEFVLGLTEANLRCAALIDRRSGD